jgi:hypothetical protein
MIIRVIGITIGLALAGMGVMAIVAESEAYLAGGPTSADRVAAWTRSPPAYGLSIYSQKLNLLDCETVTTTPTSLPMRFQSEADRSAMPAACLQLVRGILAWSPTHAYAWIVGAEIAFAQSDWEEMNNGIVYSQAAGPTELWLAQRRANLASRAMMVRLSPSARLAINADIALLLVSEAGFSSIIAAYSYDPTFRLAVNAVIVEFPPSEQAKALRNIRNLLPSAYPGQPGG